MTTPVTQRPGPTDEGVLESFLAQVVVDDYADAVPRPGGPGHRLRHWPAMILLVAIGLVVASVVISTRTSDEARQQTRAALIERVAALSAAIEGRQAAVDEQSAAVDLLRASVLAAGDADGGERESASLAALAGTTALSGPGLTVTIDDAPDAETGSLNQVLDRDIQDIVNVLWSMGAAGVAVNEQRLTGTTAIRGAGAAILVNYEPLTRPYTVTAVGTTTSGEDASALQVLLDGLSSDYGLVSQVGSGDVALPAGELRAPRFARVAEGSSTG
jgi:uncharacterized protein YlxW (UPF0749 family)